MAQDVLEEETIEIPTQVNTGERCDANCGARAWWLVSFDTADLAFCNHHYTRFSDKLADRKTVKLIDAPTAVAA